MDISKCPGQEILGCTCVCFLRFNIFCFQLISQGGSTGVDDQINLDVHAISDLNNKDFPPTDDLPKYNYSANGDGFYGKWSV